MNQTARGFPASQQAGSPLPIGPLNLENPVLLAPMSGVSDLPFRRLAARFGAGAVVSEMVASRELALARPDVVRRVAFDADLRGPRIVQLAGTEGQWMAEGTRVAIGEGAQIVDINMGCPAREVIGKQAGSALMRDLDHACELIEATVETAAARGVAVTLKMRLGWCAKSVNAAELARRAEALGVSLFTVHGRTRNQFFKGAADWSAVSSVVSSVNVPVVVNGDITDAQTCRHALNRSGAAGVMIGRGAYGAPWLPGRMAAFLKDGTDPGDPSLDVQEETAVSHVEDMLQHYGEGLGLRNARKHIGWYLERAGARGEPLKAWRRRLCTDDTSRTVIAGLRGFYREQVIATQGDGPDECEAAA